MNALREYYRLQFRSISRLINSFPGLFKIGGGIFILFIFFLLHRIQIEDGNLRVMALLVVFYLIISIHLSDKKAEKLLLKHYKVSIRIIFLVKEFLLSIPFFVINWKIGCFCLFCGALLTLLMPSGVDVKNHSFRFKFRYFFRNGSYQWQSFYRLAGFYIHLIGVFLITMGIIHDNFRLSIFAFGLIGVVLGIGSLLTAEPLYFVRIYQSPNQFIWKKSGELVFNLLALQLPLVLILAFFGVKLESILYSLFSCFVLSWMAFAVKYSRYPDAVTTQLILFLVILPLMFFCLLLGSWMLLGIPLTGFVLFYFLQRNLRQIFYQFEV